MYKQQNGCEPQQQQKKKFMPITMTMTTTLELLSGNLERANFHKNSVKMSARRVKSFNFNFSLFVVIIYFVTVRLVCPGGQSECDEPMAAHQL